MTNDSTFEGNPHESGDNERRGHRRKDVGIERVGEIAAEDPLHHVGGISADHQHLAVRHVDDPHETKGNGETQCGQQQNAAEAQPVEQGAENLGDQETQFNGAECLLRLLAHTGIRLGECSVGGFFKERRHQPLCLRVRALRQQPDRLATQRSVRALDFNRGGGNRQQRLDFRISLTLKRALDERQHFTARVGSDLCRRRQTRLAIRSCQP